MTDINKRRKNKLPVNLRYGDNYNNGYAQPKAKNYKELVQACRKILDDQGNQDIKIAGEKRTGAPRTGRTDYIDKSMHGWKRQSKLTGETVSACIGNDFSNGHRGMAKAVAGAKKFVRTRIRFKENQATKKLGYFLFNG